MELFLGHVISIQIDRDQDRIRAWAWYLGHFYLATVVLPPFVAAEAADYLAVVEDAGNKAGRALNELLTRVLGVSTTYLPPRRENHAPRP